MVSENNLPKKTRIFCNLLAFSALLKVNLALQETSLFFQEMKPRENGLNKVRTKSDASHFYLSKQYIGQRSVCDLTALNWMWISLLKALVLENKTYALCSSHFYQKLTVSLSKTIFRVLLLNPLSHANEGSKVMSDKIPL